MLQLSSKKRQTSDITLLARAFVILAIIGAPGCSTATAAGCGVGVLAGVLLAGMGAAASDGSVDTGAAMVGGSLFGLASGCSAAGVAEGITRTEKYGGHARDYTPVEGSTIATTQPSSNESRSADVVTNQADLVGIKLVWVGSPAVSPTKVGLRLERYARHPVLATCDELNLRIADRTLTLPWQRTQTNPVTLIETAQVETDIDTARDIVAAHEVEFDMCGLRRRLNLSARDATRDFLMRFSELTGVSPSPSAHGPAEAQEPKADVPAQPAAAPASASPAPQP